jgi:hypothetical protein
MKEYYTYAYLREDKTPYYIGKGKFDRVYRRNKKDIKPPKDKSRIIFLKQNLTEEEAFRHEIYMITVFGRKDLETGILHNRTDGGDNPPLRKGVKIGFDCAIKFKGDSRTEKQKEASKKHIEKMKGRIPHNVKSVKIFDKEYYSIRSACNDNNISYSQYTFLINSNVKFKTADELKEHIWFERNKKIAEKSIGNKKTLGKKRSEETKRKMSASIKIALQNRNKYL